MLAMWSRHQQPHTSVVSLNFARQQVQIQIDQTDIAVQSGLVGGLSCAVYVTTAADWQWLVKCGTVPVSLAVGFLLAAILVFLALELLGRVFGRSAANALSSCDSQADTEDETTT